MQHGRPPNHATTLAPVPNLHAHAISSNHVGIDAPKAPTGSITITGSTLINNVTEIRAPLFKLRNNQVTANQIGIEVTSQFTDPASAPLDPVAPPSRSPSRVPPSPESMNP